MDSIISTFHIDWKIIIAQVINFGVVFTVLYIYALKPLSKIMAERNEKIKKGVDDAKINAEMLEKTRAEYEKMLREAKTEADKIFESGKKEAQIEKAEMIKNAKAEADTIIENGKKTLEVEKIRTVEEAKKEIVTLAMLATEKLISSKQDLRSL